MKNKLFFLIVIISFGAIFTFLFLDYRVEATSNFIILANETSSNIAYSDSLYSFEPKEYLDCKIYEDSLIDLSYCLNKYVKSIYKYKVSVEPSDREIMNIIKDGGDCGGYTKLYESMIEKIAPNKYSYIKENLASNYGGDVNGFHTFLIVHDEGGYCLLDLNNPVVCRVYEYMTQYYQ